jgi:saccharopine dehydrogenase (NAD+, L-lysine-forming)
MKKILILGGYGNAGKILCELLIEYTDSIIYLAGRNAQKAEALAKVISESRQTNRVHSIRCDASSIDELKSAFNGFDIVVVASSTVKYVENIARAALDAKIDYYDINISKTKLDFLKSIQSEIIDKGLCFITDGGYHPGLPALMIRLMNTKFDAMTKANVAGYMNIDWKNLHFSYETIEEFVREFRNYDSRIFKKGKWKKADATDFKRFDFGVKFGIERCSPMFLEEMRDIPKSINTLNDLGFYISGFNWFVDWLIALSVILILPIFRENAINRITKLFIWGLKKYTKPPFGVALKLETEGKANEQFIKHELFIEHKDAYFITAACVTACLKQYLNANIRKPGLHLQAHITEPLQFFEDLKSMGLEIVLS